MFYGPWKFTHNFYVILPTDGQNKRSQKHNLCDWGNDWIQMLWIVVCWFKLRFNCPTITPKVTSRCILVYPEAVQNATGPLLVEIDRPFCCSLGIDLVSATYRGRNIICISNIVPASIADRWILYYVLLTLGFSASYIKFVLLEHSNILYWTTCQQEFSKYCRCFLWMTEWILIL